jgi:hypothetical protein
MAKEAMKNILLFAVIAMIGCVDSLDSPDQSPSYLSTEIKEGYSWRYLYDNCPAITSITNCLDISIDSVWGSCLDTVFFTVTRIDSILQKRSTDDSLLDSSIVVTPNILCKKTGIKTSCSDDFLSKLFTDKEYVQYSDGLFGYSDMKSIQFGSRCFKAVDNLTHDMRSPALRDFTHTLFADTIGIIGHSYNGHSGRMCASIELLKYNGTDFSYHKIHP